MGSLAASYLQQSGETVTALHPSATHLTRELHWPSGEKTRLNLPAYSSADHISHLLVATKAAQTADAIAPHLASLHHDAVIVCLQNGMGQWASLPDALHRVTAITTNAAFRQGNSVTVVAENATWLGDGSATSPEWVATLQTSWPGLAWTADINQRQLAKLAINAVINPLTAIHQCRNGELLAPSRYTELVALANEIDRILCGYSAHWQGNTLRQAEQVAQQTAHNISSMLADVQAGRPTEIDFINGWLVAQADRLGIDAPVNRACWRQLSTA